MRTLPARARSRRTRKSKNKALRKEEVLTQSQMRKSSKKGKT